MAPALTAVLTRRPASTSRSSLPSRPACGSAPACAPANARTACSSPADPRQRRGHTAHRTVVAIHQFLIAAQVPATSSATAVALGAEVVPHRGLGAVLGPSRLGLPVASGSWLGASVHGSCSSRRCPPRIRCRAEDDFHYAGETASMGAVSLLRSPAEAPGAARQCLGGGSSLALPASLVPRREHRAGSIPPVSTFQLQ
jgi:hypothetical protein